MAETDPGRIPRQRRTPTVFVEWSGAYWAEGTDDRSWHVQAFPAGWRLEFFDVGDEEPVVVGTYPTADEARLRAGKLTGARPSAR
jgi:hypothetical protein